MSEECSAVGHRTYPHTQNVTCRGDKGSVFRPKETGIHHFQIQRADRRREWIKQAGETSRIVRPERVNKWPNSMLAR